MEPRDKINKALDGLTYKQATTEMMSAINRLIASTDNLEVAELIANMLDQMSNSIKTTIQIKKELKNQ